MTLSELKVLAERATPGPWQTEGGEELYVFTKNNEAMIAEMRGTGAGISDAQQSANARLIAAANPAVVLELIARLDAMEERLKYIWARGVVHGAISTLDFYGSQVPLGGGG